MSSRLALTIHTMDILSSTPSPDNGVPDVTLTIKKMAVAPVDFQPAENSNSHQCVLVKSTQCVEMYKAHMTSDDDATSVSLVRRCCTSTSRILIDVQVVAKTLRALPKDRQHGNMAMACIFRCVCPERQTQRPLDRSNSCATSRLWQPVDFS